MCPLNKGILNFLIPWTSKYDDPFVRENYTTSFLQQNSIFTNIFYYLITGFLTPLIILSDLLCGLYLLL